MLRRFDQMETYLEVEGQLKHEDGQEVPAEDPEYEEEVGHHGFPLVASFLAHPVELIKENQKLMQIIFKLQQPLTNN